KIEDGADACADQLIRDGLRGLAGNGDEGDLNAARLDLARKLAARHHGHRVDVTRDLRGIVVDDDGDAKALASEARVVEERRAEIAEADEDDGPLPVEAEDALQLALQARDVIADSAYPELTEVREVFAHLRGVQIEAVRHFLRGDRLDAVFLQLEHATGIAGATMDRHLRDAGGAIRRAASHGKVGRASSRRTPGPISLRG